MHPAPPHMGQYQNPINLVERNILLTSEEEILLQTQSCQYSTPAESTPTTLEAVPTIVGQPLMIPLPNVEPTIGIPHISL
jgi:hypothetical protein